MCRSHPADEGRDDSVSGLLRTSYDPHLPHTLRLGRWFAFYGAVFLAACIPLGMLIHENPKPFADMAAATGHIFAGIGRMFTGFWTGLRQVKAGGWEFQCAFAAVDSTAKLIFAGLYLSLCTTFIPLPTAFLVSLMSTGAAAIASGTGQKMLIIGAVGALASTMGNLNDYHLFMLMLRSKRVAKIRNTRACQTAEKWFAKAPFAILLFFNTLQIPVDVARMLSAIYGYPRRLFIVANFCGRFVRYSVIVWVTCVLGKNDWIAPLAFLAFGALVAVIRIIPILLSKKKPAPANAGDNSVSS